MNEQLDNVSEGKLELSDVVRSYKKGYSAEVKLTAAQRRKRDAKKRQALMERLGRGKNGPQCFDVAPHRIAPVIRREILKMVLRQTRINFVQGCLHLRNPSRNSSRPSTAKTSRTESRQAEVLRQKTLFTVEDMAAQLQAGKEPDPQSKQDDNPPKQISAETKSSEKARQNRRFTHLLHRAWDIFEVWPDFPDA